MALLLPRPRPDLPARPGRPDPGVSDGPTTGAPVRSAAAALTTTSTVLALLGLGGAAAVLVAALLVGGGAPVPATPGLPSAGPVTGWGLPVATLLVRFGSVAAVGALVLASLLLPRGLAEAGAVRARAVRAAGALSLLWLAAECVRVLLLVSSLAGVPVTRLSAGAVLGVVTEVSPGRAALLTVALLAATAAGSLLPRRLPAPVLLLLALSALLAPVVLAGHSAAAADHALAVTSLAVHVVAASAWVGGLAALLLWGRRLPEPGPAVRRLSALALCCVGLLAVTGVVSAVVLTGAGSPSALFDVLTSGYGLLLLAKTVALTGLVAAGAWHRHRTLAALEAGRPRAFLRLGVAEVVLMTATVTVAVALGASPPVDASPRDGGSPTGSAAPADGTSDGGAADAGADGTGTTGGGDGPQAGSAEADPMAGHDHGELSVGVLVDDTRFHVSGSVRPGQLVTVYNAGDQPVTITADDGSFDTEVPARTFVTFAAPTEPGEHPFTSRTGTGFADTLVVERG